MEEHYQSRQIPWFPTVFTHWMNWVQNSNLQPCVSVSEKGVMISDSVLYLQTLNIRGSSLSATTVTVYRSPNQNTFHQKSANYKTAGVISLDGQSLFIIPLIRKHLFEMQIWKRPCDSHYRAVTFTFIHLWHEGPFLWRQNATEKVIKHRMVLLDRWGEAVTFKISFFPFLQSPPWRTHQWFFSPIQYLKRNHACQSCLYRWQLPWGTLTVHSPLFQLETSSMLGYSTVEQWK